MMRPLVGMTIQASASVGVYNEEDGRVRIVETVGVIDVTPGGLSDGRVQVGDVLVSIRIGNRTRTVTRLFHLIDFMMTARAGDTVVLTVLRDGVSTEIELPITEAQLTPYGLLG